MHVVFLNKRSHRCCTTTILEPVQVQKDTSAIEKPKLCLQIAVSVHVRYSLVVNIQKFSPLWFVLLLTKCPVPLCVNINTRTGVLHFPRVCNIFHLFNSVSWSSKIAGQIRRRIRSPISKKNVRSIDRCLNVILNS